MLFQFQCDNAFQLEVIGGTEMYLAVCRACYKPPETTSPLCSPARHNMPENVPLARGDCTKARGQLFQATSPFKDRTNLENKSSMDTSDAC